MSSESEGTRYGRRIEELRMMRWEPRYIGEVSNPSAPGGVVDMWILIDDVSDESIVSLGVPRGRSDIAGYVAACCGNPTRWVTKMVDRRDLKSFDIDDPADKLAAEAGEMADVIFAALSAWIDRRPGGSDQMNGWALNDALSHIWYAFCGQVREPLRAQLVYRFIQMTTMNYEPPAEAASKDRPQPKES